MIGDGVGNSYYGLRAISWALVKVLRTYTGIWYKRGALKNTNGVVGLFASGMFIEKPVVR